MADIYRSGFIGATLQDATKWVGEMSAGSDPLGRNILVPFAGTGRDIVSMAAPDTHIESWDTQRYSAAIVNGVFAAKSVETNVDKIRYRKGYVFENKPIKNIDERCAGFIDWVCTGGTDFDRACISSAVVRCTLMGRMTHWYANIEQLWKRFNTARDYNTAWIDRPGTFEHHEGSFFDSELVTDPAGKDHPNKFDIVQVDPPKIVVGSDVYSAQFNWLQLALTQAKPGEAGLKPELRSLPRWSWRDVLPRFRQILEVPSHRVIFLYVSKVRPPVDDVRRLLLEYGTLKEEREFSHQGRTDFGFVLDKD